ncbi:MAG: hypothetical protein ACRDZ4_00340 [Egibacteraceae bacterium]
MRRIGTAVVLVFALASAACHCTAEKGAVTRLEQQHEKLAVKYLKYVDADPNIAGPSATEDQKAKARQDERELFRSLRSITDSLKRSLGD